MSQNFERCLKIILVHEGGFVNHPSDPGGMTNKGITKAVFEDWVGEDVTEEEMRNLTDEDVAPIYRVNYWDRLKCDDMRSGLDLCVFDFGVNAGTSRAARYLQGIVGAIADGVIGPYTMNLVNAYVREYDTESLIRQYQKDRQEYYESLRHFSTFGRGWTRRVNETTEHALNMI